MITMRDEDDDQLTDLMMKYDYENFQQFDHRLSLYCDIALFPASSSEEVIGIARVSFLSVFQNSLNLRLKGTPDEWNKGIFYYF